MVNRTPDDLRSIVANGFGGGKVVVVGDLMLDRYLWGQVERISVEAPVPIIRLDHETEVAGGAGNVALNLAGLGLSVSMVGTIGADEAGSRVKDLLDQGGVDATAVFAAADRRTTLKDRVMGGHQQMLRIDRESVEDISTEIENQIIASVSRLVRDGARVLVLSDYAKGVLTVEVCHALIAEAKQAGIPVIVDPKGIDYSKYAGATALSPNHMELAAACNVALDDRDNLDAAGGQMRSDLELEFLVVTLGGRGMDLITEDGTRRIPAVAQEVFDVSGAGDTAIATLAAGLAVGLQAEDSLHLAALAAGVVVGKVGTSPVSRSELVAALDGDTGGQSGLASRGEMLRQVHEWRAGGLQVVFTNGCFDLLHAGHISLLEHAKREGDRLVVGLNSDDSARRLKGESRPVVAQDSRARVIAALKAVDLVVIFNEDTPLDLITAVRPDVLVKGADYSEDEVVGADFVKSRGGRVVLSPIAEGHSTSALIDRSGAG